MHARPAPPVNTAELQRLQRDHATIRAKLQQLKSALNGGCSDLSHHGVSMQQGAKPLCVALAGQLRVHIQHEVRLATRCSRVLGRMGPEELARLALEHHVDQESLGSINRWLAHESNGGVISAGPLLLSLIARVERQMDAQEADLFPFLERVLADDHHSNGATRTEGSDGMEREAAWEGPVPRSEEDLADLRNNGRGEMRIDEHEMARNGDAAGGVDRRLRAGTGG